MNILFAADVPPDPNSGAAGTEIETIRALRALGHEVDEIWADALPQRIRHANLHYLLELPRGYRDAIRAQWAQGRRYDVVHVNQCHAYLAAIDHRRRERPGVFVHRSHGLEEHMRQRLAPWRRRFDCPEWRFPRNILGWTMQWLLARHTALVERHADGTIVYSENDREHLVRARGIAADRVAATGNGVAKAFLTRPPAAWTPARLRRILYTGEFAFWKAPFLVAQAVDAILAAHPDCTFTWVCKAVHHDRARALLSAEALARTTLRGWMPQEQLLDVFDEHGIFLFPSLFEGFGKVFLEALARGLCVVGSRTGGMPEVIRPGVNGVLVEIGSAVDVAAAVERLLADPDTAASMSKAARETAVQHTWQRVAERTVAFYQHLLEL